MMESRITKTFEITTSVTVMRRIERFFALLHWNSVHGHSATFAMPLDGDGQDKVAVKPTPGHSKEVNLIAGVGHEVEVAGSNNFYCIPAAKGKSAYKTGSISVLYRDDKVIKTPYESGVKADKDIPQ